MKFIYYLVLSFFLIFPANSDQLYEIIKIPNLKLYKIENNGLRFLIPENNFSAGVGFGTKLTYDAFSLVATGFYGHGLGIRGQRSVGPRHAVAGGAAVGSVGALDDSGKERKTYGGYIQGTFDFGQGTSVGYSYGGNYMTKTGRDMNTTGVMNGQTMHSGMIWHNVTDNFRLVAEGGYTEKTWYLADEEQEDSFGGVGAFFFW